MTHIEQPDCALLQFSGLGKHLCIPHDLTLLGSIEKVMPSWPYSVANRLSSCTPKDDCVASVRRNTRRPDTYNIESVYMDEPLLGLPAASAVCALVADVLETFSGQTDTRIVLHAGAFAIGRRLIAVTGPRRAGKSTLIGRLCADTDVQVFCDDVLPINLSGQGVALGVAPRLRLPLPNNAAAGFQKFVKQHLGPHDGRYGYVCSSNLAPHGTQLPLGALVVLDRQAGEQAHLCSIPEDDALFYALQQNMGNFGSPDEALASTQALLGSLNCVRLVYSDLEEAVQLLKRAFACNKGIHAEVPVKDPGPWAPATPNRPQPVDAGQTFTRTAGATLRRVGDSAFLWQNGEHCIWRLNAVAQAVWSVLEVPGSAREVAEALGEVFVQVPRAQLLLDVRTILGQMQAEGFVVNSQLPHRNFSGD